MDHDFKIGDCIRVDPVNYPITNELGRYTQVWIITGIIEPSGLQIKREYECFDFKMYGQNTFRTSMSNTGNWSYHKI